ncbi:MAG: dihydroorotase [bacterium]
MNLLIKNGRVIDPFSGFDEIADILIENGKIKEISNIKYQISNIKVIDAADKIVTPGLIDIHTHLREPGEEEKETIATGTKAAIAGGFTTIACMPNTKPPIDNPTIVHYILKKKVVVNVVPIGAVSKGLVHREMVNIDELIKSGVCAISDDGYPVMDADFVRKILEATKNFNIPFISHCEDTNISKNGVMNEGYYATTLKLPGIPKSAEETMVARNIALAELTQTTLHIAHVSTKRSVELVREAKKRGVKVTCEVTPHHFTLTDEAVLSLNPNTKMKPPLRSQEDIEAIKEGLQDGTIDVIASDHAPHTLEEKAQEYKLAPFGVIGLETTLGLVISQLVNKGILSLSEAMAKLTINPANVLNLDVGELKAGKRADITIIDLNKEWTVDVNKFESKARNCPFDGWKLQGKADMTIVGGKVIMEDGKILG